MILFQSTAEAQRNMDWQGHRGARGLLPENTVPAFLKALEFEVTTLELDLAVSKDNILIVSHEPWMSEAICSKPDGSPVDSNEAKTLKIRDLTYEQIKQYDCGSRGNARFPQQQPMKVHKPSLADVVEAVRSHCKEKNRELPRFNIELKCLPEGYGIFTPHPEEFARLVLAEINRLGISDLTCLQSFDVQALQAIKKQSPQTVIALLVENLEGSEKNIERLGFTPDIYSPYYLLIRKKTVKKLHEQGIKVIPWTVNKEKAMRRLIRWGVDGIITDYPNLINGKW